MIPRDSSKNVASSNGGGAIFNSENKIIETCRVVYSKVNAIAFPYFVVFPQGFIDVVIKSHALSRRYKKSLGVSLII